jgi:glycosyltransferase involved in cell wall biosynthesis
MKVLIVHPGVSIYGGAERVIVKLCEYMSNHSVVHTVAMSKIPDEMKADLLYSGTPQIIGSPALMANINNFDIINYHNFPATLYSMITNKPGVWYCNEPPEMFTSPSRRFIEWGNRNLVRNRIENVVVADKFNARRLFDLYDVVPKIIPYGIDYEYFSQVEHRPNPEYFTVLQVGTISRYKNQLATIEAVAEAKQCITNIRLWLVGNVSEPDYKREIEDAISEYHLGGCISWEPHISRDHLRSLYAQSNILLHPVKEQGGWLSPFEAISAGCPVIVSKELTCSDMIENNRLGIVTSDYVKALRLIHDYPSINSYGHSSVWVKDNLTWDKFGESMVRHFEEVLCPKSVSVARPAF